MPRNSKRLVTCDGAVGRDGVLQAIDELTRIDTGTHTLDFDNQSGTFTVGTTITGGTSTATAVIRGVIDAGATGTLIIGSVSGTFQNDEEISEGANTADVNGTATAIAFPYPQKFVFTNVIIVCYETDIFELVSDALVHKLTVSAGSTFCAIDFHDYIYLSNGTVAVERDAKAKTYSESSTLPTAMCACNFNGQAILGSPDAGYEA